MNIWQWPYFRRAVLCVTSWHPYTTCVLDNRTRMNVLTQKWIQQSLVYYHLVYKVFSHTRSQMYTYSICKQNFSHTSIFPFQVIIPCALAWLSLILSFGHPDLSDPPSPTSKNANIFCTLDIFNKRHLWVLLLSCHYILFYPINVLALPGTLWGRNICICHSAMQFVCVPDIVACSTYTV